MPTPVHHTQALRLALRAVMETPHRALSHAHRLGLDEQAAGSLWAVHAGPGAHSGGAALLLHFGPDVPARAWPHTLRSPLDGTPVPVRAICTLAPARAHTAWVQASNGSHFMLRGTLAAVLRLDDEPTRLLALTAGHVCGAAFSSARGDELRFEPHGNTPAPFEGVLLDWQPNFARLTGNIDIDAGIAEIDPQAVAGWLGSPADWPTGSAQAFAEDTLLLRTRCTVIPGRPDGTADVTLTVADDPRRRYVLRNALWWRPESPVQEGDSGAPVWNSREELVALHAGGQRLDDGPIAYATLIGPVLRWAGASVVRRGEPLRRTTAAAAAAATAPTLPMATASDEAEIDILARTLYGEARGEGELGMEAVAHVVFNRVEARSWWGRDVIGVCRKPWQFSCWNANDPNATRLLTLNASDPFFAAASRVAARVHAAQRMGTRLRVDAAAGLRGDITFGATHYYAPARVARPRWAAHLQPCARIGHHHFFRGVA
ncbi:cell wall hydrolase [Ideonella sp. 4Y16]|uniref:cell wall hydrolase n=1 Tax=Ideonella alba TaxID=2824118 RepID=UPI001B39AFCA|nr:cell wall hydrolase [Ideonella alba]MBQ0946385.1 cell wall hydrolase [Ideonella alba]